MPYSYFCVMTGILRTPKLADLIFEFFFFCEPVLSFEQSVLGLFYHLPSTNIKLQFNLP